MWGSYFCAWRHRYLFPRVVARDAILLGRFGGHELDYAPVIAAVLFSWAKMYPKETWMRWSTFMDAAVVMVLLTASHLGCCQKRKCDTMYRCWPCWLEASSA